MENPFCVFAVFLFNAERVERWQKIKKAGTEGINEIKANGLIEVYERSSFGAQKKLNFIFPKTPNFSGFEIIEVFFHGVSFSLETDAFVG